MFTKGQKIRLAPQNTYIPYLEGFRGKELTVSFDDGKYISFVEDKLNKSVGGAWHSMRFEAVPTSAPKVNTPAPNNSPAARAKTGRFASRRVSPKVIRNGSLYNVSRKQKGQRVLQVARVRTVLRDGTCVMSRHGKKFFANKKNITLAPQSDVDVYLQEAKVNQ